MVTVNIKEDIWEEFMKQSIDKGVSASERISTFIKNELEDAPE